VTDGTHQVRARLRRDVFVVPGAGGARVVTHRGTESFTGTTVHQWLRRLAPHLDGTTAVGDLVRGLPAAQREMVERVVGALVGLGLVRDGGSPGAQRAEIGLLDSFVPAAERAYRDFRQARVVAVGTGPVFYEALAVLARSGAGTITASDAADGGFRTAVDRGVDLVLHVPDRSDPAGSGTVDAACDHRGIPLVRAEVRADELWIHAGTGGRSGWQRLDRWGGAGRHDDPAAPLTPEAVSLAASTVGLMAFRLLTGVAEPAESATMTCLHLASLRTSTHRFLPIARTSGPSDERSFLDSVEQLAAAPPLDPAALDVTGARLSDPRLGVLGDVSEADFVQLPVNVAAVAVAGRGRPVTGAGPSVTRARWRAVLGGIAAHAVSTRDGARLVDGKVWALRLADGTARQVDAATVFAAPDEDAVGAAARYSWSDAVTAGLLGHCALLTARRPGRAVRLDPAALGPDEEARAYLAMLAIMEVPLAVYDVTGELRTPTLAFCSGARTVAYVSALRPEQALAEGLLAVVLDAQARRNAQPAYAPPAVPRLAQRPAVPGRPSPPRTREEVVGAFRASGLDPVVVPLDHDPAVRRIMPFAVRVVIVDA